MAVGNCFVNRSVPSAMFIQAEPARAEGNLRFELKVSRARKALGRGDLLGSVLHENSWAINAEMPTMSHFDWFDPLPSVRLLRRRLYAVDSQLQSQLCFEIDSTNPPSGISVNGSKY